MNNDDSSALMAGDPDYLPKLESEKSASKLDEVYLNVYTGADSVKRYFDPGSSPPLPLVELPDSLNPFREHGVRIYAKMMSMHPANNVKAMPALNLLQKSVVPETTKTVVEYSSGSTVLSMSLIANALYGLTDVRAFISNKTSLAKIRIMQLFGINLTLFGGPSQPEPNDERGGIRAAERLAQESGGAIINPNQYENSDNWKAHVKWTGPQILRQLPDINVICAGMGTSGTMTGLGTYFKEAKPSVYRLGVCTAAGDRVPGPRSYALLAPVKFPWQNTVDHIEHVGSHDSFRLSMELTRQGLVCGPSSGLNLSGLLQFLDERQNEGTLSQLAGGDGEIHCAFLCCDLPYQYVNEYFDKLEDKYFPSIKNEGLLDVDLYRYDEAWERDAIAVINDFYPKSALRDVLVGAPATRKTDTAIIDLRQHVDFERFHLPGSTNVPFVHSHQPSPFSDPVGLASLWTKLKQGFKLPDEGLNALLSQKRALLLCYDGDSSRVANSVLRQMEYHTESVRGGFKALQKLRETAESANPDIGTERETNWLKLSSDNHNGQQKQGNVGVAV